MFTALKELTARMLAFFRTREMDRDFDEELRLHLTMLTEDNVRRGMTPEDARRAAAMRVGGLVSLKEQHRETRGLPALETILQDVRYSLRALRRDASLALFAVAIVGIGVGASSTVFSTVSALLLRPLPFDDPDRLVWIKNGLGVGLSAETVQVSHLLEFRAGNQSFAEVAAYMAFYGVGDNKLTGAGEPERLTSVPVSENFFPMLGVRPELGRVFTAEECKWNGPKAVLLSHHLWTRRFASDPGIVGRALTLDEQPVTVVGVLPASFDFGTIFAPGRRIDLYSPFPLTEETDRWGNTIAVVGRLKPGATLESAQAEATVIGDRQTRANMRRNDFRPQLSTLREHVSGSFRAAMFVLSAAVAMVMLIVCANLSNLLLARSATRQKEMALRVALGAGRRRLIQQVLTESLILSLAGAALGLLLAVGGTRLLAELDAISIPLLDQIRLDASALAFALFIALVTGIGFGLMPALRVATLSPQQTLRESGRGASEGHGWTRRTLVVSEIALACMLLAGAGLLIRSFTRVMQVNPGFEPQNAVALRIDPSARYSTQDLRNAYFDDVLSRVRALPGIQAAGLTDALPLGKNRSWGIAVKGKVFPRGQNPSPFIRIVSDGYITSMGIPVIAGRDFSPADTPSSEPVIIVNETLARRVWPGEDPLGKIIRVDSRERRVIGVVADVRHLALEKEAGFELYLSIRQTNDFQSVDLVVRGARASGDLASAVRAALMPIDPTLPANEFRTIQGLIDRSVSPRRFIVMLLGGFAGFALLLAALGIYGVISYSVSQRRQEIGIRMALGASATEVQKRVLLQTLTLTAIGVTIGFVAAWLLGRLMQGLLFEVTPSDPMTFVAVIVLLTIVAALAGYLPARHASRVDPLIALRAE